jgi:8-amino-7-oxononanoate synthase
MMDEWQKRLEIIKENDLLRSPPLVSGRQGCLITIGNQKFTDFSNNDALGLGQKNLTIEAQAGAGASRLVTGNLAAVEALEKKFAAWMGFEAGLYFPSGWQANVALLPALFTKKDLVLSDEFNHASLVDGLRLSGCRKKIFPHKDLEALKRLIDEEKPAGIVLESLYSVNGDFFPLSDLLELTKNKDIILFVDEAHAAGIYGDKHRGCLPEAAGTDSRVIKLVTCSKALGAQGGMALMSKSCREFVMNRSRGFIYSTGVSPLMAELVSRQIESIQTEDLGQNKLLELSEYFYDKLSKADFNCLNDRGSHIISIDFDDHEKGRRHRDRLYEKGFYVAWMRYPTVPEGHSRLRFSLNIFHTKDHILAIIDLLTT